MESREQILERALSEIAALVSEDLLNRGVSSADSAEHEGDQLLLLILDVAQSTVGGEQAQYQALEREASMLLATGAKAISDDDWLE